MKTKQPSPIIDYFPLLAYFGFWLQAGLIASIMTGEPKLMALGLVTAPAILALGAATVKVHENHKKQKDGQDDP